MKEGTYKEMKQNKAADQKKNEKREIMTEDVERAGKSLNESWKKKWNNKYIPIQDGMEWNGFIKEMMENIDQWM